MYNKIMLIGTMKDHPHEMYDTDAHRYMYMSLSVPPPSDAPPTHWAGVYDLRSPGNGSGWSVGDDTFLVICRDPLLIETCVQFLHKGDLVCIEGRLVLTLLGRDADVVPLAEILASNVLRLKEAIKKEEHG